MTIPRKRRDREALMVKDLTPKDIKAILQARPPERSKAFNDELQA